MGLRVYGAQVYSRDNPGACTDSQLEVPVDTGNRQELRSAISSYKPYDDTPTGYALQQAGKDLGDEGRRNIILVSDGEPTCDPDPCRVARKLGKDGVKLRIDVVGQDVNAKARKKLQCVADAGGGLYYDASSGDELSESLTRVSERAARTYQVTGSPVTGAASAKHAPEITPGDWVDVVDSSQPQRFYRIKRTQKRSSIFFSAAYRAPDETTFNRITLKTPDGQSCANAGDVEQLTSGVLVAARAASGPFDPSGDPLPADHPCVTSKELIAEVDYQGDSSGIPLELRVTEVPEASDLESLPKPVEEAQWSSPREDGSRTKVTGGTSFVDAESLGPGHYRGSIVPGETLTFTTEVDWGQQLDVSARLAQADGRLEPVGKGSPRASLELYSPSRAPAGSTQATEILSGQLIVRSYRPTNLSQTTGPVNLANAQELWFSGSSLAGVYTVTLFLEDTAENAPLPVPFEVDIAVTGEAADGPAFEGKSVKGPEPSPDATESPSGDGDEDSEAAAGSGDGLSVGYVLGGLGLVVVLLAGGLPSWRRWRHGSG